MAARLLLGVWEERESFVGVNLTATAVASRRRRVYFAAFLFLSRTKAIRPGPGSLARVSSRSRAQSRGPGQQSQTRQRSTVVAAVVGIPRT